MSSEKKPSVVGDGTFGFGPLPHDTKRSDRAEIGGSDEAGKTQTGPDILLVEDNKDIALSMTVLMGLRGHPLASVRTGADALSYIQRFNPRVFLLDFGLPDMDGLELAKRLRSQMNSRSSLFVGLSGHAESHWGRALHEAGFDAYFLKPANLDALCHLIDEFYKSAT